MGYTISVGDRAALDAAKSLGWSFPYPNALYSSGRTKAKAAISYAKEFLEQQQGIEAARIAKELAEKTRLALIKKNNAIALALQIKLENQRISDEQAEIKRLFDVAEIQRQAEINAENLRIKLLKEEEEAQRQIKESQRQIEENRLQKIKDKETQRTEKAIPLLASIIPLSAIGLLLLYTSRDKK